MSSRSLDTGENLLEARGVSKSYELDVKPPRLFFEGISGRKHKRDQFLALKPLDLDIKRGSSVGILGRNGAGKSTLLGILAGVIEPTHGVVHRKARVAALIGIGQSFSIEETGRVNAARFCRIQGLSGAASKAAVERVRAFAELGGHFDRPVKTYSSGMRARLNFACATGVEADLIIIDEVLAVGDAEFRSKCYGHIEASIDAGQTYIMVSHSPAIIGNYCSRVLVLDQGELKFDGDPLGGMQAYEGLIKTGARRRRSQEELLALRRKHLGEADSARAVDLAGIAFLDSQSGDALPSTSIAASETPIRLRVTFQALDDIARPRVGCGIRNGKGIMVAALGETIKNDPWRAGETRTVIIEFVPRLAIGSYLVRLSVADLSGGEKNMVFDREGAAELTIVDGARSGLVDVGFRLVDAGDAATEVSLPAGESRAIRAAAG